MDIIIRDVTIQNGQYKIYNKDGTGGHWYISKESAEVISSQLEPLVIPKIAEESTHKTKYEVDIYTNIKWLTAWTGDLDGAKSFINDIKPTNIYRLVKRTYTETKETIESNFSE